MQFRHIDSQVKNTVLQYTTLDSIENTFEEGETRRTTGLRIYFFVFVLRNGQAHVLGKRVGSRTGHGGARDEGTPRLETVTTPDLGVHACIPGPLSPDPRTLLDP